MSLADILVARREVLADRRLPGPFSVVMGDDTLAPIIANNLDRGLGTLRVFGIPIVVRSNMPEGEVHIATMVGGEPVTHKIINIGKASDGPAPR